MASPCAYGNPITPPPLLSPFPHKSKPMLIDKFYLLIDGAVAKVCKRFSLPLLHRSHLFCLYTIKRSHVSPTSSQIIRRSKEYSYPVSLNTIYRCLRELEQHDLIHQEHGKYTITPLGREVINSIRRYLLNKRL